MSAIVTTFFFSVLGGTAAATVLGFFWRGLAKPFKKSGKTQRLSSLLRRLEREL